jgi:hypothetical protein
MLCAAWQTLFWLWLPVEFVILSRFGDLFLLNLNLFVDPGPAWSEGFTAASLEFELRRGL